MSYVAQYLQLLFPAAMWLLAQRMYRHFECKEKVHGTILRRHFLNYQGGACTLALLLWFALVAISASISGTSETYLLLIYTPCALALGILLGTLAWAFEIREYLTGRPSADW